MFRKPKRRNANQRQTVDGNGDADIVEDTTQPISTDVKKEADVPLQTKAKKSVLTFGDEEEEYSLISSKNLLSGNSAVRSNLQSVHKVRKRKEKSKSSIPYEPINIQVKQENIEPIKEEQNGASKSR
jgi:hypothetical protein